MSESRVILMGDPACFHIRHGANPHTRNRWGFKKRVDRIKAREQWQAFKERLEHYGATVHVIPPDERRPGLVFPANAAYVPRLEEAIPLHKRECILSQLNPARSAETAVYEDLLNGLGMKLHHLAVPFEGQADLIPWGERFIFTYGRLEGRHLVPSWCWPPWRWVYGFRSDQRALQGLSPWVPPERTLTLELADERFYHGDTVLCSYGPRREFLLVYADGLKPAAQAVLKNAANILYLSEADAQAFAANSFQLIHEGQCILFMPDGISEGLRQTITEQGVHVEQVDVSEFFEKGGGSVKCMIGDLGVSGTPKAGSC